MEQFANLNDDAAERAVLGSVLLSPSSLDVATSAGLTREDFRAPSHRLLFDAFLKTRARGEEVDMVTLGGYLTESGDLKRVGGFSYLSSLSSSAPSVMNMATYVSRVQAKATSRRAFAALSELRQSLLDGTVGGGEVLDAATSQLAALRPTSGPSLRPASALAREAYDQLRSRATNPSRVTGLSTGFDGLDKILGGLQPTDLIVLAARPGMGKTALALNIVGHAALRLKVPVAFFSLEMGELQLVQRLLSAEGGVEGVRLRSGDIEDHEWTRLRSAARKIGESPLFIVDKMGLSIDRAAAMCRSIPKLGLVVVDYLQLMSGPAKSGRSREQEIAAISRGLKGLAKELNVPVLALAQLNRGVEYRADKRPMMADLRESGAIEQDADIVVFLYREDAYGKTSGPGGTAELLIRKHRNGAQGNVSLCWRKEFTRFESPTSEGGP
jgi:replicative DNA helicase